MLNKNYNITKFDYNGSEYIELPKTITHLNYNCNHDIILHNELTHLILGCEFLHFHKKIGKYFKYILCSMMNPSTIFKNILEQSIIL